jgi:hypothetical protein
MKVYNALDLKNGAKADYHKMGSLTQPIQFLPTEEKNDEWVGHNMDWLEFQGMKHIRRNAKRLLKNYKLAKGIIDKSDYIIEEDNEMADLIDTLTKEDSSAFELKFYPIIPNVVNVLCSEFSKRISKIQFRAIDDISYNEMIEQKRQMIEDTLLYKAQTKMFQKMMSLGLDPGSEEAQEMMNPENIKTLPEIESFFKTNYRSSLEEWATHQKQVDEERFSLKELEERAFRDMLITDREFWHFKMNEDDYEIELWNPVLTFYHKSPDTRYISQGNWVGKIDLLSAADVIDKYGWMMSKEELESIEAIYPVRSAGYAIQGYQNDGSYYDATKSHEWNTQRPSLHYRQFMSLWDSNYFGGDVVEKVLSESEDMFDYGHSWLLRVTTTYWKSQKKIGHLTKITDTGDKIQEIVSEDYKITDKPLYNDMIFKNKTKDNLVFGEHIDWIWINEVWGGIKIGPNRPAFYGQIHAGGMSPIYLGMQGGKAGRVPFQFKGDSTLYGCKLPVEGAVFSDRNTRSVAPIDLMKPYQIGFNIVNNQIADILVDELGTIIALDQNALPRHSLGEDWGKGNYSKAYVAMKNFQILPFDTTLTNTENSINFQHYQVLDLEQSKRLMSRVELGNYFRQQAFAVIGINPERMGEVVAQQTATGVEQAVNASYAQTEVYFTQHSDYLMPRVHQMRTDLAQYYNSKKPSVRLQYITQEHQKINFQINGTDLLLRDFNVFCTTRTNQRQILDQLRSLALNNNTTNATIFDLGNIIKAESVAELTNALKAAEAKMNGQRQQEYDLQQEQAKQQLESQERIEKMKLEFEAGENEKDRQKDILVAEIRSAGYGSTVDIDENMKSDYQDALDRIQKSKEYQEQMDLKREQESNKSTQFQRQEQLKREELASRERIAEKTLQVARENKNKYDKPDKKKS